MRFRSAIRRMAVSSSIRPIFSTTSTVSCILLSIASVSSRISRKSCRAPPAADFCQVLGGGTKILAHFHLDYETIDPWASIVEDGDSVNSWANGQNEIRPA